MGHFVTNLPTRNTHNITHNNLTSLHAMLPIFRLQYLLKLPLLWLDSIWGILAKYWSRLADDQKPNGRTTSKFRSMQHSHTLLHLTVPLLKHQLSQFHHQDKVRLAVFFHIFFSTFFVRCRASKFVRCTSSLFLVKIKINGFKFNRPTLREIQLENLAVTYGKNWSKSLGV